MGRVAASSDPKEELIDQLLPTVDADAESVPTALTTGPPKPPSRSASSSSHVAPRVPDTTPSFRLSQRIPHSAPVDDDDDGFLLPLPKANPVQERRARLLAGAPPKPGSSEAGMKGARELREELGEQLADVSVLEFVASFGP